MCFIFMDGSDNILLKNYFCVYGDGTPINSINKVFVDEKNKIIQLTLDSDVSCFDNIRKKYKEIKIKLLSRFGEAIFDIHIKKPKYVGKLPFNLGYGMFELEYGNGNSLMFTIEYKFKKIKMERVKF